jgi:photosystem II stability/assembly factor-like uncharacterized protein
MRISMRASGVAVGMTALLAALSLTGCGSVSSGAGAGAGSPVSTTAPGTPSGSPATPAAATPTSAAPDGGPVPSGFAATSVTFVSTDEAFVLGTAPCSSKPCTSIVRTLNRGATWAGLPAPVAPLADPYTSSGQRAVWGIRFADPSLGFVFGNGLWETTNGGEQWEVIAGPGGSIIDLEVIDGQLLALTDACTPQSGCTQSETLYRRALDGGSWHVVTHVSNARVIATQAQVAAVLDGSSVVITSDGGLTFAVRATPCASPATAGSSAAVTGPDSLALLCAGGAAMGSVQKTVYVSDDLGAHWARAGSPPLGGDPWGISAGTTARLLVGAASGASWLYYSDDGGVQWSTAYKALDGGAGFNDLGFTTTTDGVAVLGPAYTDGNTYGMPGQLLLTSDGGATWQTVTW